jgi:hypothetical protein
MVNRECIIFEDLPYSSSLVIFMQLSNNVFLYYVLVLIGRLC